MSSTALCALELTIAQGPVYTGISRWERISSRRASRPSKADGSFHASLLRAAVWNLRIELNFDRESAAALRGFKSL